MLNKKAVVDWMIPVGIIIALLILGAAIYFIYNGTSSGSASLKNLQDCVARKGHCESSETVCKPEEIALPKALGCEKVCCLPPFT